MINNVSKYLGFAINSGKIIMGLDDVIKFRKRIGVILYDHDLKENSYKKLMAFVNEKNIKCYKAEEEFNGVSKLQGVKVLAVLDLNLADAIIKIKERS